MTCILDDTIKTLCQQAAKAYGSSSFNIYAKFFEKDQSFQLCMLEDHGDRRGDFFSCVGSGPTLADAAKSLIDNFVKKLEKDRLKKEKDLEGTTKSLTASIEALRGAQSVVAEMSKDWGQIVSISEPSGDVS